MKNIRIARIDDRLIHGQVVTAWVKTYPIQEILIVADDLAKNLLMQRIYKSVAPHDVEINVLDKDGAVSFLKDTKAQTKELMVLVKTPDVFEYLIDNGIEISKIIIGGMGLMPGRQTLIKNVSANEAERETLRRLIRMGVRIVYQMVPNEKEVEIGKLLEKQEQN